MTLEGRVEREPEPQPTWNTNLKLYIKLNHSSPPDYSFWFAYAVEFMLRRHRIKVMAFV